MEFLRNVVHGPHGLEGDVYFRLFDKYINFVIEDAADLEYVESCARYLNQLDDSVVKHLCEASIRYCNGILEAIGESPRTFGTPKDVLPLIYPSTLIVPNPEYGSEPVVHMELNCEWEPEHGMEWIVRGNQVLYVGAFNGEYPWSDFSTKESWNYA